MKKLFLSAFVACSLFAVAESPAHVSSATWIGARASAQVAVTHRSGANTHASDTVVSDLRNGKIPAKPVLITSASDPARVEIGGSIPPNPESLLDKMTGKWVMTGTIAKQQVTHDVDVDWILNRRYIRIHEVSHEKNAEGELIYEAWIHIAWDPKNGEYVVMWLDNTGTTNFAAEGVGHGKPNGDRIPFVWKSAGGGGIHNTFAYDRNKDKWSWAIDNIDSADKPASFARVTLERKKN